jgi:hypothetical protein
MFSRSIVLLLILIFTLTLAVAAQADVAFTLEPTGGGISGAPGDTIGWGFTVSNDTASWLWVGGSVITMDKDSSWGTYNDTSSNVEPLAPRVDATTPSLLSVPFTLAGGTGAGSYSIDPTAPFGDMARGYITFNYTLYDANPYLGGNEIGYGSADVNATVATPEPTTYLLLCLSLGVVGYARKKMMKSEG